MAISIGGTVVIDNDRNITNANDIRVGTGITMIGSTGNIETPGTISAGGFDIPPVPISFSPTDSATGVAINSNIAITFSQSIEKGTGIGTTANITLRNSSGIGTVIETIGVTSTSVTVSGAVVTINPVNSLPNDTDVYVVVDAGAFTGININTGNELLNTYNFTTIDFVLTSINPANGATNVGIDTNITLTFTSPPVKGTGTVQLKSGSTSGTISESFNVSTSSSITTSGNNFIINPTNNLGFSTTIHTIIPSTAITGYVGLNTTGADTHSFTTRAVAPGDSYEGGFLICQSGGTNWIVSSYTAEVSRNWYSRNDAATRAQQVSGCTGWFVPSISQYQNPGFTCRTYWDSYTLANYWTPTEFSGTNACFFNMSSGNPGGSAFNNYKSDANCVRAFRTVSY